MARAAGKKKSKRVKRRGAASRTRPARTRAGAKRRTAPKRRRSARPAAKSARRGAARTTRARAGARTRAGAAARKRTGAKRTSAARATLRKRAPARPAASRNAAGTAASPVPAAFAAQRAMATAREELLFELQRARASVKAATQGLTAANAERPIAAGKWSIKEIVLHLSERDRVRLEEFSRTLGGQPRTWAGISDAQQSADNETHLAPLRAHSWESAVRRLDSQRELLLLRLSEVPAHPDDVWRRGHPFADMMWGLPEHDRHHARQIKRARIGELVPAEE